MVAKTGMAEMERLKALAVMIGPAGLMIAYFILGAAQIVAFIAGIKVSFGWPWWVALIVFVFGQGIPFAPLAMVVIAFIGANTGWGWPWWQALLLVAPFAIITLIASTVGGIGGLLGGRRPQRY